MSYLSKVNCTLPVFSSSREIMSPLDQFEIRELLCVDIPLLGDLHLSISNIGFYLTIGAFFLLVLNLLTTNYNKLVS